MNKSTDPIPANKSYAAKGNKGRSGSTFRIGMNAKEIEYELRVVSSPYYLIIVDYDKTLLNQ